MTHAAAEHLLQNITHTTEGALVMHRLYASWICVTRRPTGTALTAANRCMQTLYQWTAI
jgi:hypothetical protein